jgi:hypothetical protein
MLAVLLLTALTILACVGIHWEGLVLTSRLCAWMDPPHRVRVAASVVGALIAHLVEIAVFAVAIQLAVKAGLGGLEPPQQGFEDLLYFSATVYSSLGFGDVVPNGPMRQLVGIEAVTGLVLIAWTASFTFVKMEKFWGDD